MSRSTKWLNFLERVLWTLLQVASASGIIALWELARGDITNEGHQAAATVILTVLLAAIKNAFVQSFGNPTGSTLPKELAPVPAEDAEVLTTAEGGTVAGPASPLPTGTPVLVQRDYAA